MRPSPRAIMRGMKARARLIGPRTFTASVRSYIASQSAPASQSPWV